MKNFLSLVHKFLKKSPGEQLLYGEIIFWLSVSRLAVFILPFKFIAPFLGKHMAESGKTIQSKSLKTTKRICSHISTMSHYLPWECKCLVQAISGKMMLDRRKILSTLYLGVTKDDNGEIIAHAWLRSGEKIILGGGGLEKFVVVSTFA